jgi:ferritin-like metal-binding protein YciE
MATKQTHKTATSGKTPAGLSAAKSVADNSSPRNGDRRASGKGMKKENDSRLEEFFNDELKDIYWAEKHLVKTLPKMAKAATSKDLKTAFTEHLEVTKGHVSRLEEVFGMLGLKPQAKKCDAIEGITREGESIIEDTKAGTATRDVGLILAGQKAEHYEIATYGGLAQVAKTLGYDDIASLLEQTLAEEKEADQSLTELAENSINEEATEE